MTRRLAGRLDRLPAPEHVQARLIEGQGRLIADIISRSLQEIRDRAVAELQAGGHAAAAEHVRRQWPGWVAGVVPAQIRAATSTTPNTDSSTAGSADGEGGRA